MLPSFWNCLPELQILCIFQESVVRVAFLSHKKISIFEILMPEPELLQEKVIFPSWFISITVKVTDKLETSIIHH